MMAREASDGSRAVAQPVTAPLARAAIFLIVSLEPGLDSRATLRSLCTDLAALVRAPVLLGADAYTALAETRDHGYPVLEHVKRLVEEEIIWAPAIAGAFVLTTRGGDFELALGQDVSIGYSGHSDTVVRLYLQETFTFRLLTTEAAVALVPPAGSKSS